MSNITYEKLNLNHFYYFYVVAKEGSVKAAAESLHVTQPTVSDQLKLLEDFLGHKLFDRRSRALYLNTQGKLALEYAEKIFSLSQDVVRSIKYKNDLPKKVVDIGITNRMSQYFVYEKILSLLKRDEVAINIKEGSRHHLIADLENGELDLIISDSKENLSGNMDYHRVGTNKTLVVAHKSFKKLKKNFPKSLNEIPYFSYTKDSSLRFEVDLFFSRNDIMPKIVGEADDIDLFELVTKEKIAFTIVPEVAALRFCAGGDIIVLGEISDLQTSVWGIIQRGYRGAAYTLLTGEVFES